MSDRKKDEAKLLLATDLEYCRKKLRDAEELKSKAEDEIYYWTLQLESAQRLHARYSFGVGRTPLD